jgi:Insulinase (Peptidase family M16)
LGTGRAKLRRVWGWQGLGLLAVVLLALAGWGMLNRPAPLLIGLNAGALRAAYLIPDAGAGIVEFHLTVQSGENENPYTPGLAHYVEHLAWLNAFQDQADLIDRHANAWTSASATSYALQVPSDRAAKGLQTLAQVLAPLALAPDFMAQERQILLREYDLRLGDNPLAARFEAGRARLHRLDPRARPVLGTPADIAAMRLQDAIVLHRQSHRPDQAVLVVYGAISAANAEALIATTWGDTGQPTAAAAPGYIAAPAADRITRLADAQVAQPHLIVLKAAKLPQATPESALHAQLDLLHQILTSSLPGSLAKPLRYDSTLAHGFDLLLTPMGNGAVEVAFHGRPGADHSPEDLLAGLDASLGAMAVQGVPHDTFARLQARWLDAIARDGNPARAGLDLALMAAAERIPPQSHATFHATVAAISLDQINTLLRAIAAPGPRDIQIIAPQPD